MAYDNSFVNFINEIGIGQLMRVTTTGQEIIFLENSDVHELVRNKYAIVSTKGGLVLGNFHTEGGVHILTPFNDGFRYVLEMEGYEFLMNNKSTDKYHSFIESINAEANHDINGVPKPFHVPRHIRKIDLSGLKFQILVIPYARHFIVNRTATEKNLELINEMNGMSMADRIRRFIKI